MKKFYDTNALLKLQKGVFNEYFVICTKTLEEIESIKTSDKKDAEVKYNARRISRLLDENKDKYEVVNIDYYKALRKLKDYGLKETPDNLIMLSAYIYNKKENIEFITDDICCKNIGRSIFKLNVNEIKDEIDEKYTGFKIVSLNENELAKFYENVLDNKFKLLQNQYLIIKDKDSDEIVDKLKWNGEEYENIKFSPMESSIFGKVKPFKSDVYQQCAMNSLQSNKLTMLKGKSGSGKSYLALAYLFNQLEKRKIDKIIIFCNTIATSNSAKLGYYPGSKDEKLMDSAIGNMLSAKFGDKFLLEEMINKQKIVLLPMSDIRGYDTTDMNAGIYITEAQNMDVTLMKLALQRIGDDCICILDGDYTTQVDMSQYSGNNNGMRRVSEIFKGQYFYGEVELQNIYRGKIAEIADLM